MQSARVLPSDRQDDSSFRAIEGYIHSNSIMKLVLALKAKAIPLKSLTKPTKVLCIAKEKIC